jgi:hypothetical protein
MAILCQGIKLPIKQKIATTKRERVIAMKGSIDLDVLRDRK